MPGPVILAVKFLIQIRVPQPEVRAQINHAFASLHQRGGKFRRQAVR